ncbi:hypothetical protein MKX01_017172 [Papaver californicum]|nr:hypothetical protein MKX01_017172 [Papaver californicum]
MKNIIVVLMGCGGVGKQLIQHIINSRSLHSKLGLHLRVIGVCDSTSFLVLPNVSDSKMELNDSLLMEICRLKSSGVCNIFLKVDASELALWSQQEVASSPITTCSCNTVFVTCIDIFCAPALTLWCLLAFPFTTSVGAGLPVIASINRILTSGDPIHRIIGSLSGTLGYVMSEVEGGKPLSEVVRAAKGLGYTEPDPREDLGGMDATRKVESLYPDEMGPAKMSVEDFLSSGLPSLDNDIRKRFGVASSNRNVLRYVCSIEGSRLGSKNFQKDSPLGRLRGSDNVLEVYSRCYSELPLVIQGAGAGNDTTAAGVLADILDLQDLFP